MTANQDYVRRMGPKIVDVVANTTLFPSVVMAQAILESGYGRDGIAARYNNHFGIKADSSWKGPVANLATNEVLNGATVRIIDGFRVYSNVSDSIRDHLKFLKKNKRYTKFGVHSAKSPEEQAIALQNATYSTSPVYAKTLIQLIKMFNLKELDVMAKKKD